MRKAMSLVGLLTVLTLTGLHVKGARSMVNAAEPATGKYRIYVGAYTTYGKKDGKGIYAFEFDPVTGKSTSQPRVVAECANPSFLAFTADGQRMYAVTEVNDIGQGDGQKNTGGVIAFRVDPATGGLTHLNTQPAHGTTTCHVSLDQTGSRVLVANYGKGTTAATYKVLEDGSLSPSVSTVQHVGKSHDARRQEAPHGHSINLTPDQKYAVVADLGLDQLKIYPFNRETGELDGEKGVAVLAKPGAGPRHFTFHPNQKYAYHNNELDWTVTAYSYADGKLNTLQTLSTVPADWTGSGGTAEVAVHPNGKFLYVSNRGPDTLAIYHIQDDGTLRSAGFAPTGGKFPRNFVIDPTGEFLFAANQNSDDIHVFRVDQKTGGLTPTGEVIQVPMPVCVRIVPVK